MTTATLPSTEQIMTALHASTKQVNGERRNVTSHYVLADLPDNGREVNRKAVLKVSTYHSAERKRYSTSVMQVEQASSADGPFSVEKFSMFSGVGLITTPVARHSAKAMAAAHTSGLQVLEIALHQAHPTVVEQFQVKEQG